MSTDTAPCQPGANERSAIEIAWSCIAVIFACVWKAVHPNVPPANLSGSKWQLARRRLFITLWTFLLPEFVLGVAADQWLEARRVSQAYNRYHSMMGGVELNADTQSAKYRTGMLRGLSTFFRRSRGPENRNKTPWTKTHSFFLLMGGFVTTRANGELRILSVAGIGDVPEDAVDTAPRLSHHWPMVEEDEINDKSTGDMLTKALVIMQTAWFVIQLIARAVKGLAITELEIMTLAYGLMCAFLYGLWWNKPYDVQKPILIHLEDSALVESIHRDQSKEIEDLLLGSSRSGQIRRDAIVSLFRGGLYIDMSSPDDKIAGILLLISAILFGCIHCLTWNFQFLTRPERLLWISSSLVVAALPCLWMVVSIFTHQLFGFTFFGVYSHNFSDEPSLLRVCYNGILKWVLSPNGGFITFIYPATFYIYCLARIILIVQAFVLLRDLSPSTAQSISWAHFIPHV